MQCFMEAARQQIGRPTHYNKVCQALHTKHHCKKETEVKITHLQRLGYQPISLFFKRCHLGSGSVAEGAEMRCQGHFEEQRKVDMREEEETKRRGGGDTKAER